MSSSPLAVLSPHPTLNNYYTPPDLNRAFSEFLRVLRPGGRLCILEITAPRPRLGRALLRGYMRCVVPLLTRITTGHANSQHLWEYYWDTIDACLPPQDVMRALALAGFTGVPRHVELAVFSEYTARKPDYKLFK